MTAYETATPWWVVVVLVLIPIGVSLFLGIATFRGMTPLAYACRRCGQEFRRAAHRRFPARCPRCGARDWNA